MELSPDMLMGYGLINKISTGYPVLDTLLCLLVPVLLRTAVPWLTAQWNNYFYKSEEEGTFTRAIEYTKSNSYWWYDDDAEPCNSILQRAVINYINSNVDIMRSLPNADFQLRRKPCDDEDEDGSSNDGDDGSSCSSSASHEQHSYMVNYVPPEDVEIDLKNGITFERVQEEIANSRGTYIDKSTKITYFLTSKSKNGNQKIDDFVEEALALYKAQQASKVDTARYLYIPVLSGWAKYEKEKKDGEGGTTAALYKRYKLSEEKTFASFFHPDKHGIMGLVDQFVNKKGKFGIPGYPQKLGFLLYGPPGTGKTSFIKALSQYTKRSVISIPLSKIQTNQELMDIMFDQKISVEGQDSINLPFHKTIFVMEDVDAASNVVQRRDEGAGNCRERSMIRASAAAAAAAAAEKKAVGDIHDVDDIKEAEDDKQKKGSKKSSVSSPAFGKSFLNDDELNLAGLLNVLDGVVDTPNRIIIMTTNHPEKLDPALIRPGRINKKIYMGRICVGEALGMMRHYFGQDAVSKQVEERLRQIFIDEALSPAELETMCADHDTPEDMVKQLDDKFRGSWDTIPAGHVKEL